MLELGFLGGKQVEFGRNFGLASKVAMNSAAELVMPRNSLKIAALTGVTLHFRNNDAHDGPRRSSSSIDSHAVPRKITKLWSP